MGNKKLLNIYTDGACSKNPGPGGWSSVALFNDMYKILSGYEEQTTNNRMELLAVINTIQVWGSKYKLKIYTDSKYVIDNYLRWKKQWKSKDKSEVKNVDLWDKLFKVAEDKEILFEHVRGHKGILGNEIADTIAVSMYKLHKF